MTEESYTWQEIISQSQTWRATLDAFKTDQSALEDFVGAVDFDHVLVVGCGSTHYLAQTAATTLTRRAGVRARALPASELWLFPNLIPTDRTMLLAISRSGTTTETLRAMEQFREVSSGRVLAITCYPENTLAQRADFALVAPDAQEQSVAQTRSFTSMLLLTQALTSVLVQENGNGEEMLEHLHRLPDVLEGLVNRLGDLPQQLGEDLDIERLFFLGGGPLYGLASEAMLKTKEMSLSYAEAYYPLEFRHGPMSMVNEHTLVIGFLSDTGLIEELQTLKDMQELGARILALVEGGTKPADGGPFADWQADHVVELRSGLDEWERGPLYLPAIQQMAYHRAVAKGLNPDRPHNLTAVVKL
jgi:glucosamine--fructose-6-phosphate aminotransferase (isomerizing)